MYNFGRQQHNVQTEVPVPNNSGGDSHQTGDLEILERILTFGATGTYYVGREDHATESFDTIRKIGKQYGVSALLFIAEFSQSGRAASNDHAIAALAVLFPGEDASREYRATYRDAFNAVIRIPTHLFLWVKYTKQMRPFGRAARTLVNDWYNRQTAYSLLKYQGRYKWTHADVWNVAHPKLTGEAKAFADWSKGVEVEELPSILDVYQQMLAATSVREVVKLIEGHKLTHEFVPTEWQKEAAVWEALLPNLPTTALLRNLNKYAVHGIEISSTVRAKLCDQNILRRARMHPLQVLTAKVTYESGRGFKGTLSWVPSRLVVAALEDAFQMSFHATEPIGKNILVALDVSGSMGSPVSDGSPLSCAMAGAALAMYYVRRESNVYVMGYAAELIPLPYRTNTTLEQAVRTAQGINFGATNCALPYAWARRTITQVDCFISITDSEANSYGWGARGNTSTPSIELAKYRQEINPDARSIVLAMTSGRFTIHDPRDLRALDIAGFDASIGNTINNFFDK